MSGERRARRRPGENRRRLMEAGLVEFGLFGYHGASTAAIAARAEVPQPHVYTNFTTKQELFLSCVRAFLLGPAEEVDDFACMLQLQAVAASASPQFDGELQSLLEEVRVGQGSEAFASRVSRAVDLLRSVSAGEPAPPGTGPTPPAAARPSRGG